MKTFSQKPAEVEKKWILVDAQDVVLGRLASIVASRPWLAEKNPDHRPGNLSA